MSIERWGWCSVALNGGLIVAHGLVAWQSGSLAVAAELVHNIIDLVEAAPIRMCAMRIHLASCQTP